MAAKTRRNLIVNWRAIDGAAHGKRKLVIRSNDGDMFTCPVKLCLHADFNSSRGLRKHIDNKHPWYYYFDEQPEVKREDMSILEPTSKKVCTSKKPAFSLEKGVGKEFIKWLRTTCGGGKNSKEAQQIGRRAMKFFMEALGNNESDNDLTYDYVDCCLGSASILINFLETLEDNWKISSSASLNYVKAISDMVDFRKASGVNDNTLRYFTIIEVYLRRAKENLRKKKNLEKNRNLDLESLIAKDSWASLDEMEEVIPFHIKNFNSVIRRCIEKDTFVKQTDLVFCTRFITTLLFLRVKCSRPMTFQYLTVEMVLKSKKNGGFIDQTEFKTAETYLFDTLIMSEDIITVLELYINHVRPRLDPKCNYLLLSSNGTQFTSLTTAMTMLVHEAIGKHINPTRYRQIVETESSERLTREEQQIISEDQKHSSNVAKIFYKKKQSRIVAIEGKKCMEKMTRNLRQEQDIMKMIDSINSEFDENVLNSAQNFITGEKRSAETVREKVGTLGDNSSCSSLSLKGPYDPVNLSDSDTDLTVTPLFTNANPVQEPKPLILPRNNISVKKEVAETAAKKCVKNVKFSPEEDFNLRVGIEKYGKSWANIIKDKNLVFHPSRTRDSLRMRADSATFKRLISTND